MSCLSSQESAALTLGLSGQEPRMRGDRRGMRFGRLLVESKTEHRSTDGHVRWICLCDCGRRCLVNSNCLRAEAGTRSCGCLNSETAKRRLKITGPWNAGKSYAIGSGVRCYKTRHAWSKAVIKHYGNRCELCGWDKARCDAHHRHHKARGGINTIANGIVLCPNCHRIRHEQEAR